MLPLRYSLAYSCCTLFFIFSLTHTHFPRIVSPRPIPALLLSHPCPPPLSTSQMSGLTQRKKASAEDSLASISNGVDQQPSQQPQSTSPTGSLSNLAEEFQRQGTESNATVLREFHESIVSVLLLLLLLWSLLLPLPILPLPTTLILANHSQWTRMATQDKTWKERM